jgi:hypothetical protein
MKNKSKYNFENADFSGQTDFPTIPDSLDIPKAIMRYHQDSLFRSWQVLESQQSQTTDPEIHAVLNIINQTLFSAWVQFRGGF